MIFFLCFPIYLENDYRELELCWKNLKMIVKILAKDKNE